MSHVINTEREIVASPEAIRRKSEALSTVGNDGKPPAETNRVMPQKTPPRTVLIVDDSKDAVDIIAHLLSQYGLTALRAYSGQECLDIVRSRPVDVIVLDLMMPGMDGLEVCRHLKQAALTPPIVLLTDKDDMAARSAGMSLGVSEFIVKPVNNRDLIARIKTLLSTRRQDW